MLSATDFAKLRARSQRERMLLVEAGLWLGVMQTLLVVAKFQRITALYGLAAGECADPSTGDQAAVARRIGWAVGVGASRGPWRAKCLGQALAAMAMLRRRRVPGTLYLGVASNLATAGAPAEAFAAHAWVICGDTVVTGEDGFERFSVIARFAWM